ncbi:MAG: hypothetical protein M3O68_08735, partial [Thermoproteota archaeon]|nr:hypothetical protein [Thermoproteota archaeon]
IDAIPQTKEDMFYVDALVGYIEDFHIIDVRMLKNSQSNPDGDYLLNIVRVTSWLQCKEKVVICSGSARSRSPAIAVGVLVKYFKLDFYSAWEQVRKKVPFVNIDYHIISLKRIFGVG